MDRRFVWTNGPRGDHNCPTSVSATRDEMASVFRKTATRPLPVNAEMFTRKGERFARWTNDCGKLRSEPITTDCDGSDRLLLQAANQTDKNITSTTQFIRWIAEHAGFTTAVDISADGVNRYACKLQDEGRAARTVQGHLNTIKAFTK